MKKYILPICLWVSLLVIIVLGIVLSEATFASNKDLATYGAIKEIYEDYTKTEVRTSKLADDGLTGAKVIAVYDVYNKSELLGYAYIVTIQTHQKNPEKMNLLVAMDPKTEKLLSFKVLSCDVNDYYNTKEKEFGIFHNTLKNTLVSEKNYLEEGTYNVVSGATSTTNSIVAAIKVARVQFYKDINKELPVVSLSAKLNSVTQNLSSGVFNSFTADMTVTNDKLNNAKVKVEFTYDYESNTATYVSADKTLDSETQEVVMKKINLNGQNYIKSYNAETGEFVVVTFMKYGSTYTSTLKVAENGTITDFSLEASNGFVYNVAGYADNGAALLENIIAQINGSLIENVESLDSITAATVKSSTAALLKVFELVEQYKDLGGNE